MIFEKRGMWKSSFGNKKFMTYEEAKDWEEKNNFRAVVVKEVVEEVVEEEPTLSPLERLRGWKDPCNECECDPCECEEEWNSVEETSSETESSTEETS